MKPNILRQHGDAVRAEHLHWEPRANHRGGVQVQVHVVPESREAVVQRRRQGPPAAMGSPCHIVRQESSLRVHLHGGHKDIVWRKGDERRESHGHWMKTCLEEFWGFFLLAVSTPSASYFDHFPILLTVECKLLHPALVSMCQRRVTVRVWENSTSVSFSFQNQWTPASLSFFTHLSLSGILKKTWQKWNWPSPQ